MKHNVLRTALVASLSGFAYGQANSNGCYQENGNWYCAQTNAITYTNFGQSGSFNKVTSMDPGSGVCLSQPQSYSGGLAPLDEVSFHFRGPLRLKQFAFYTLGGQGGSTPKKQKRDHVEPPGRSLRRRHSHHHRLHHRNLLEQELSEDHEEGGNSSEEDQEIGEHVFADRGLGDWVTMTMEGKVVSWQNQYAGAASPPTAAPAVGRPNNRPPGAQPQQPPAAQPKPANPPAAANPAPQQPKNPSTTTVTKSLQSTAAQNPAAQPTFNPPPISGNSNTWTRQSYYTATSPGSTSNLAFLGHYGDPTCSGTFDYKFGLSLSYLSPSGQSCSPNSQPLSDILLPDNKEISLFTGQPCTAQNPCAYSRPGSVAHHGFSGASKLFLLEFSMPLSGQKGWNLDMPAVWILNAMIPRTLQYGDEKCSCWKSGCGEFDVMEVLDSGNQKCKSTWHGQGATGESDWFQRPTGGSRKAAVVMQGGSVSVLWLDDKVDFGQALGAADVQAWLSGAKAKVMPLGGK